MSTIREDYEAVKKTLDEGGIGMGDFFKATGQYIASPFTWAYNKITDGTSSLIANVVNANKDTGDNVYIPEGTKTLLGHDFTSLYISSELKEYQNADGTKSAYIESTSPYSTEMKSGNASANTAWSYAEASGPKVKAIYEITLLSKKYASMYQQGNDAANDKLSTEYADYMSQYRAVCEQQGVSWNEVMTGVSAEMQTQCYYFSEESKDVLGASNADANRVLVNRAHSMLRECMGEGYQDNILPALVGKLTYEDTLDVEPKNVGFFTNIGTKFSEFWTNVKDNWPHPFRAMKNAVAGYVSNVVDLADSQQTLSSADWADTMSSAMTDAKENLSEAGGVVKDKLEDTWDKVDKEAVKDKLSDYETKAEDMVNEILDKSDDTDLEYN